MKLGWIGLGDMGQVIVPRLIEAGHTVAGWNRTASKADPLMELGMRLAESPRELAAESEICFSMVTDANAVEAIALGEEGVISGLSADGIYLDMSTIDPQVSRNLSAAFAERGLVMMDAPISGSPVTIAQGSASTMVGGDGSAYERVKPVLLDIGSKVSRIGAVGHGGADEGGDQPGIDRRDGGFL